MGGLIGRVKRRFGGYRAAHAIDAPSTVPAFIYATSTLYEPGFEIAAVNQDFRNSITGEPDNPLTPVLFAVFLDRMMYRFNDGFLSARALDQVAAIAADLPLDDRKIAVQIGPASRDFIRLKVEQQKVMTLAQSHNPTIHDDPGTLRTVEASFSEYSILLPATKAAVDKMAGDLARRQAQEDTWLKRTWGKVKSLWNEDADARARVNAEQVRQFRDLWNRYSGDRTRLRKVVDELALYQASLKPRPASPNKPATGPLEGADRSLYFVWLLLLIVVVGLVFVVHALRSRTRTDPKAVRTP